MGKEKIFNHRVDTAIQFLLLAQPGKPITDQLKAYFRRNRQMGSKDRRAIRDLVFSWFRAGFSMNGDKKDQIILSHCLLHPKNTPEEILIANKLPVGEWKQMEINQRLSYIENNCNWNHLSLLPSHLISEELTVEELALQFFKQSPFWIHTTNPEAVARKLSSAELKFTAIQNAIGLASELNLASVLKPDEYEVQDLSSQKILDITDDLVFKSLWDCCAASGGKSLHIKRERPEVDVFASDIRQSSLLNLNKRFKRHGLTAQTCKVDLTSEAQTLQFKSIIGNAGTEVSSDFFDFILADVPCTGSGTWSRNPEFLHQFEGIGKGLLRRQKSIIKNSWSFLKPGGYFLYSTCSIFRDENEAVSDWIVKSIDCRELKSGFVKGYEHDCDTMYFALFEKLSLSN